MSGCHRCKRRQQVCGRRSFAACVAARGTSSSAALFSPAPAPAAAPTHFPAADKGKAMSLLPLDPSLARALLAARDLKCLDQVRFTEQDAFLQLTA